MPSRSIWKLKINLFMWTKTDFEKKRARERERERARESARERERESERRETRAFS